MTTLTTNATKRIVRRERPNVHLGTQEADLEGPSTSFFSGHSSSAFTSVFTLVQTCPLTGCGGERWIWLAGLPAASVVGLLRIRADKHYAADVMTGAAVGAAIGSSRRS